MAVILKNRVATAWLFILSIALSIALLEFGLRMISPPNIFTPLLPLRPFAKMKLRVDLRGVSPEADHTTNRWGFRGDPPPVPWQSYRTIVAVGGSTTQCFYLDDKKTWPYLLQEKLKKHNPRVWVGNGGLDGHSTRAHLIFMNEVATKIKPDTVIFLTGINDLGISITQDRFLYGSPYDRARLRPVKTLSDWLLFNSRLVQLIYLWKWLFLHDVTIVDKAGHGNLIPQPLSNPEIGLPENLDVLLPQLGEYRENLRALIQKARSLNVEAVFLTQPMLFEDSPYWRKIEGKFYWIPESKQVLSAATYWKLLERYNGALLEVCREEKVPCFDLANAIPHDGFYFYDSVHFTEAGAELVASKVADFLLNQKGIGRRRTSA